MKRKQERHTTSPVLVSVIYHDSGFQPSALWITHLPFVSLVQIIKNAKIVSFCVIL